MENPCAPIPSSNENIMSSAFPKTRKSYTGRSDFAAGTVERHSAVRLVCAALRPSVRQVFGTAEVCV
jgi:hypothetical protein